MRLAAIDGRACLVVPGGVVELGASGHPDDPMACLARWDGLAAWAAATDPAPTGPLDEARLTCPVPRPTQVFAIGLNYRAHCEETGAEVPTVPLTFTKFPSCLAPRRASAWAAPRPASCSPATCSSPPSSTWARW